MQANSSASSWHWRISRLGEKNSEAQQGKAGALPLDPIKGVAFKIHYLRNRGLGKLAPVGRGQSPRRPRFFSSLPDRERRVCSLRTQVDRAQPVGNARHVDDAFAGRPGIDLVVD